MTDPLAQVVALLQPRASFSKVVTAAGQWRIHRTENGRPFYCAVLHGSCRLAVQGHDALILEAHDFVLIPAAFDFTVSNCGPGLPDGVTTAPVELAPGVFRVGDQHGSADLTNIIGHCAFGSDDAALLVSLLPGLVHVRGQNRLSTLVQLVAEESANRRPARDIILARLVEVLLIEALRSSAEIDPVPGLLQGLADDRLSIALRQMHADPTHPWTVAHLAREAALSRSAFFDRFKRALGLSPMAYLLQWRMALAKDLLRRRAGGVADIAQQVGYSSASTFSIAFARHVGQPPAQYARLRAD